MVPLSPVILQPPHTPQFSSFTLNMSLFILLSLCILIVYFTHQQKRSIWAGTTFFCLSWYISCLVSSSHFINVLLE